MNLSKIADLLERAIPRLGEGVSDENDAIAAEMQIAIAEIKAACATIGEAILEANK